MFGLQTKSPVAEICSVFGTNLLWRRYVQFFDLISCGGDMFGLRNKSLVAEICSVFETNLPWRRFVLMF